MPAKIGNSRFVLKLVVVVVVLAAIGVAIAAALRPVATVVEVRRGKAIDIVTGSVVVHPDGGLRDIKSEVGGWVVWCEALEPDRRFKAGETLVRLDDSELVRTIDEKKRQYNAAKKRYEILLESDPEIITAQERLADLQRRKQFGTVAEEEITAAERALAALKHARTLDAYDAKKADADYDSEIKTFELQREKMAIKAPWDGVVHAPAVSKGALVTPTQTVATAYSNARIVIAKISEEDFSRVRLDQRAEVRLLIYGDKKFDAKVIKILNMADPDTQRYTVYLEVALEPEKLAPFSTGEVSIIIGESESSLLIPRRAVFNNNQVLVVKDGRVEQRKITVGFVSLIDIEVRDGLAAGERVIVENIEQFRGGQRVRAEAFAANSDDE